MGKRRKTPPRKISPQREAPEQKAENPIFSSPFKDLKKLLGERAKGPAKSLAKGPFKTGAAERDSSPAVAAATRGARSASPSNHLVIFCSKRYPFGKIPIE